MGEEECRSRVCRGRGFEPKAILAALINSGGRLLGAGIAGRRDVQGQVHEKEPVPFGAGRRWIAATCSFLSCASNFGGGRRDYLRASGRASGAATGRAGRDARLRHRPGEPAPLDPRTAILPVRLIADAAPVPTRLVRRLHRRRRARASRASTSTSAASWSRGCDEVGPVARCRVADDAVRRTCGRALTVRADGPPSGPPTGHRSAKPASASS